MLSTDVVSYEPSIRRDVFVILLSVIMCVGAIATIIGGEGPEIFALLPFDLGAWGWLALSAWAGSRAVRSVFDRDPRLIISADGLIVRISSGEELRLAWSEIKAVRRSGLGGLGVELWHPEQVESRMGPIRRLWTRINRLTGYPPIILGGGSLKAPVSEVVGAIREELDRRVLEAVRAERKREMGPRGSRTHG